MHNAIPFYLAGFIAAAVTLIGCSYLVSPGRAAESFGIRPPEPNADNLAWLRLKGVRDVTFGLLVLTLMLASDERSVGIALLVAAIVPFGDMSVILGSRGSKSKAFLVHGLTCAVIVVVGLLLIHAI